MENTTQKPEPGQPAEAKTNNQKPEAAKPSSPIPSSVSVEVDGVTHKVAITPRPELDHECCKAFRFTWGDNARTVFLADELLADEFVMRRVGEIIETQIRKMVRVRAST